MAFLHGNVAIATCEKDMVLGSPYARCSRCGEMLKKVPLLYPIKEKNYNLNPYISMSWTQLEQYLQMAYRLTIFGYSAPKSDQAAIDMLKQAWGAVEDRNLEEIEIIDIRPEEDVIKSWAAQFPELCQQTDDDEQGGLRFEIDKSRISIRLTAPYSEERRNVASKLAMETNIFIN